MNFGTVGTSWITSSFIKASEKVKDFNLVAVYSRSEEKANKFAEQHQADYVFSDLHGMANSDKMDCVYIASPNSLHYEQALLFLKNKKHVICEKPIFSNTKELLEAHRVAEDNDVYLFEAIRNIHSPNFKALEEAVRKIGQVRSANLHRSRFSSRYNEYLQGGNPNVFTTKYSGGALTDMGIYPLYLAVSLFGKPTNTSYSAIMLESGVDGSGTLVLNYNSFIATIMTSKISTSYLPCEIQGEKGTVVFDDSGIIVEMKLVDNKSNKVEPIETYALGDDMKFEMHHFVRIISERDKAEYDRLKELSLLTLSITEEARKQNGIVYGCEK